MFEKGAKKVTNYFLKNKIILKDEVEIYVYGFELLISTFFSISILLLIGITINKLPDTIIFLFVYCSLRKEAGGFHANTHFKCTFIFVFVYCLILLISHLFTIMNMKLLLFILFICNLCFLCLSPVQSPEIELNNMNKKKMKMKSCILLMIYELVILYCVFSLRSFERYVSISVMAILWESILLFIGTIQRLILQEE